MKKHTPRGPFAPPMPKTAEGGGAEPMAVANDKATQSDAFMPTSSPRDAFDHALADRYGQHVDEPKSDKETRSMQRPPGYTEPDENGWSKLIEQQEE